MKLNSSLTNRLLILILAIIASGLLILYQASIYYASEKFDNKYYFIQLQLLWTFVGLCAMFFFFFLPTKYLQKLSLLLWVLCVLVLVFILFDTPFAPVINGSKRWFYINPEPFPNLPLIGRFRIQPSELTKLAVIMYLAFTLAKLKSVTDNLRNHIQRINHKYYIFVFVIAFLPIILIARYNLSTALILTAIVFAIFFVNGIKLKIVLIAIPIVLLGLSIGIYSMSYRLERFITLVNLQEADTLDEAYHINQILIALGSGGLTGLGYGQSRQKFLYVPEVSTDSIFAIAGEELGFIGGGFILLLILSIILILLEISKQTTSYYGKLFCVGLAFWIFMQTFINIGAMVRILPITGVPLPLVSYGGSSTIFLLSAFGIALKFAYQIDQKNNLHHKSKPGVKLR